MLSALLKSNLSLKIQNVQELYFSLVKKMRKCGLILFQETHQILKASVLQLGILLQPVS